MNQIFYDEIYKEPRWYKWVDFAVVLLIGLVCGIVFAQGMKFYDVQTTTTTSTQYQIETPKLEDDSSSGNIKSPSKTLKFEQI